MHLELQLIMCQIKLEKYTVRPDIALLEIYLLFDKWSMVCFRSALRSRVELKLRRFWRSRELLDILRAKMVSARTWVIWNILRMLKFMYHCTVLHQMGETQIGSPYSQLVPGTGTVVIRWIVLLIKQSKTPDRRSQMHKELCIE